MTRTDKRVILKAPPKGHIRHGHCWIYRSQIASVDGAPSPGEAVEVLTDKKRFLGTGYYNAASEITVRLLSRQAETPDTAFFARRLTRALEYRRRRSIPSNACRIVSSEADGLPGLIVDRYDEVVVVQFLTMGMERLRPHVLEAIEATLPCRGLYERSDSHSRKIEGLSEKTGWIRRDCASETEVNEAGIRFRVRFEEGHKTGFYLDQRDNRILLAAEAGPPGTALDAFCYEGGFGLHLARAGWRVTGIDIKSENIAQAEVHRALNGIEPERLELRAANVFDELKSFEKAGARFDLVVLDPPSFVKKRDALEGAVSGYKEIVLRSLRLLSDGGRLAVFSCAYHLDETLLLQTCLQAAVDVRRNLKILRFLKQSADHPIVPFIPETYYLKGFLFEAEDTSDPRR